MTRRMITSKIRAAFIAPCLGTGGADMLMARLVSNSENIEWVGAAIRDPLTKDMAISAEKMWPSHIPIYNHDKERQYSFINHVEGGFGNSIIEACREADIVVTWCVDHLPGYMSTIALPLVEYAQNCDKYAKQVVQSNEAVVTHRAACSQTAAKVFGDVENVAVIYNGIDFTRCTPRKGRELQRKVWGIDDNKKIVLYMGRLVKEKHPEDLIRCISALPEDYVGVFVGNGITRDQYYDLAQSFCPGRIAFVKPEYYVGDFLAAADCFLLPSDFEGHPLALMEAMIAGVPCVYTDFEVMRELHSIFGPLGQMVPRGCKTETIVEAVLAHDSTEATAYRNNARLAVWDHFNIAKIAWQWEDYLTNCLFDFYRKRRLSAIYPTTQREPLEYPQ
jgi:glycosyltransferase involved in cell wall biosynthesis